MSIRLLTGFDGSCPHYPEGIKAEGDNKFTVFPGYRQEDGFSEENSKLGGSRFYTRIENLETEIVPVEIIADWEIENRIFHHDLGYIRFANEGWGFIPGIRIGKTKIRYSLNVRPGITELALSPEYNYETCEKFIDSLKNNGVKTTVIGQSENGRDMWMIEFPSLAPNAENFFIQARDHAYETAGSFCVEGIVELLRSGEMIAEYLRSKFNFYIVPMTNPDGVYSGMSRLSREKGADMNRILTESDKAHDVMKATLDRVAPKVYMNIHNWTNKFIDGLFANDEEIAEKIMHYFPNDFKNYKRWKVETHKSYLKANNLTEAPEDCKSWKNYCKEKFRGYGVNFEFPWFALFPDDMRGKGKLALTSLALAAIEEMNL